MFQIVSMTMVFKRLSSDPCTLSLESLHQLLRSWFMLGITSGRPAHNRVLLHIKLMTAQLKKRWLWSSSVEQQKTQWSLWGNSLEHINRIFN
jgi:hypothetical protein